LWVDLGGVAGLCGVLWVPLYRTWERARLNRRASAGDAAAAESERRRRSPALAATDRVARMDMLVR
jgi:hypothetical protein